MSSSNNDVYPTNWTKILQNNWPWTCHVYGLAIAWFLLGLYAFIVAINIKPAVPEKGLLSRMCAHLVLSAILRAMYLLIDPYESKQRLLPYFCRFLYVVVHPCLLGSFVLSMMCLFRLGGIRIKCRSLDNPVLIQITIVCYAAILGVLEVASSFYPIGITPMYVLIEFLYLLGHLCLALSCFHYGIKLIRRLKRYKVDLRFRCFNLNSAGQIQDLPVPKIRITDENNCSTSFKSELSSAVSLESAVDLADDEQDFPKPRMSPRNSSIKITGGITPSNSYKKLQCITVAMFIVAFLALSQVIWLVYERIGRLIGWQLLAKTPTSWLTVMTIYRISELLWANLMTYTVQHGFNRM